MDLQLDGSHDLAMDQGDLHLVDGIDEVAQRLRIRLQFFLGEWFLDTSLGIPYHEEIFVKNPNRNRVSSLLKETIQKTDGVKEILGFTLEFDPKKRSLSLMIRVNTDFGTLDLTV